MSSLPFSIIVPTIDGQHTLPATIASIRSQAIEDFEVVVADSSAGDQTQEFVGGLSDPRMRLLRTRGLSIADNWEAGVAEARGDYVFVLGHDDALMPDALEIANRVIGQYHPSLLSWSRHFYGWPTAPAEHARNRLVVIFGRGFGRIEGIGMVQAFFRGNRSFEVMPMIYNSFVHRDLIDRVRSRHGRYFCGEIPDVHSGIVNAYYGGEIIFSNRGLSVSGSSGWSSGSSGMNLETQPDGWRRLVAGYHQKPLHGALAIGKAETLWDMMAMPEFACAYTALQAKDQHFTDDDRLQVDVSAWMRRIVPQLANYPATYAERREYVARVAHKHGLSLSLPATIQGQKHLLPQGLQNSADTSVLTINCEQAGVTDVDAAARLARSVLPPPFG